MKENMEMNKKLLLVALPVLAICISACGNKQVKSNSDISKTEPTTTITPGETVTEDIAKITDTTFLNNFNKKLNKISYTLTENGTFSNSGFDFTSYTIVGAFDSAYLALNNGNASNLATVLVISNPSVYTYFYDTSAILSVDENADYTKILSELNVTESGEGESGKFATEYNGIQYVFERTDSQHRFCIMINN